MRRTSLAIALTLFLGSTLNGWAEVEAPGCDRVRAYWQALQLTGKLAGTVVAADLTGTYTNETGLSTNNWILVVPAVTVKWPNVAMQIDLGTPNAPTVTCDGTTLSIESTVNLAVSVFPAAGGRVSAFTMTAHFFYDPTLRFDFAHPFRLPTNGAIGYAIASSSVGPIDLSLLSALDVRPYFAVAHP
jgi:hypothetical protein